MWSVQNLPILQTLPLRAGIIDMRHRFREIYQAVQEAQRGVLPFDRPIEEVLLNHGDEPAPTRQAVHLGQARLRLHFVILPGLFADCLSYDAHPFQMRAYLQQYGYEASILWVNGRSSNAYNAETINQALRGQDEATRLVFVGYSKGSVDALQAVITYPEIRVRTAAIVSVAGAVYGSPIAAIVPAPIRWLIRRVSLGRCKPGDGGSLESLKPSVRLQWLADNPLPPEIRYFALAGTPQADHVSRFLKLSYLFLLKHGGVNDSQVLYQDTMIPNSQFLGFVNADHFAIALPISKRWWVERSLLNWNDYPREILLESMVRYVEEQLLEGETLAENANTLSI